MRRLWLFVFVRFLIIWSCVVPKGSIRAEEFRIYRQTSPVFDSFKLPPSLCGGGCGGYGGTWHDSTQCKCGCNTNTASFAVYNSKWACVKNEDFRTFAGCGYPFYSEPISSALKVLELKSEEKTAMVTTGCTIDLAASRYLHCDGTWAPLPLQSSEKPFKLKLDSSANIGGVVYGTYKFEVVSSPDSIKGQIIILSVTCAPPSRSPCLLFKMAGDISCQTVPASVSPNTLPSTSLSHHSSQQSTSLAPTTSTGPANTKNTTVLQVPTNGGRKRTTSSSGNSGLIAGLVVFLLLLVLAVILIGFVFWKRRRGEEVKFVKQFNATVSGLGASAARKVRAAARRVRDRNRQEGRGTDDDDKENGAVANGVTVPAPQGGGEYNYAYDKDDSKHKSEPIYEEIDPIPPLDTREESRRACIYDEPEGAICDDDSDWSEGSTHDGSNHPSDWSDWSDDWTYDNLEVVERRSGKASKVDDNDGYMAPNDTLERLEKGTPPKGESGDTKKRTSERSRYIKFKNSRRKNRKLVGNPSAEKDDGYVVPNDKLERFNDKTLANGGSRDAKKRTSERNRNSKSKNSRRKNRKLVENPGGEKDDGYEAPCDSLERAGHHAVANKSVKDAIQRIIDRGRNSNPNKSVAENRISVENPGSQTNNVTHSNNLPRTKIRKSVSDTNREIDFLPGNTSNMPAETPGYAALYETRSPNSLPRENAIEKESARNGEDDGTEHQYHVLERSCDSRRV
ncbi:uncharacterized protein LOC116620345 [Nematostella vectensis]|uniref:uncharacterized protein LOC116620345 n=1 Tax=Nematostella vectensis TaxID=45351 RepID=UPI0020778D3F|nr:uncharacterized protein LOC116620345 [Nematostella vectensis]